MLYTVYTYIERIVSVLHELNVQNSKNKAVGTYPDSFVSLLKKAASGKAHNDPDSARLILEIYGNLSLSRQTAQTLRDTAEKLKQSVSSNKDADSDNDVPSLPPGVDLGRLKRKEVDALEQIFKIWANESEEEEEEDGGTAVGSMEKPWDCRLRQLLMDRYDARVSQTEQSTRNFDGVNVQHLRMDCSRWITSFVWSIAEGLESLTRSIATGERLEKLFPGKTPQAQVRVDFLHGFMTGGVCRWIDATITKVTPDLEHKHIALVHAVKRTAVIFLMGTFTY